MCAKEDDPSQHAEVEIEFTVKAKLGRHIYLTLAAAKVEEGEFKGTSYNPSVAGYMPILYVYQNGISLGTSWIPLNDFLVPWLEAVKNHERV